MVNGRVLGCLSHRKHGKHGVYSHTHQTWIVLKMLGHKRSPCFHIIWPAGKFYEVCGVHMYPWMTQVAAGLNQNSAEFSVGSKKSQINIKSSIKYHIGLPRVAPSRTHHPARIWDFCGFAWNPDSKIREFTVGMRRDLLLNLLLTNFKKGGP